MKVLLLGPQSAPFEDVLRCKVTTSWNVVRIPEYESAHASARDFSTADALVSLSFDGNLPPMPMLKLLQTPSVGLDWVHLEDVPAHVPVCNAYGHEIAVAEYNVLAMLACAHDIVRVHRQFSQGRWYWSGAPGYPIRAEIHGKVVCIIGLGRIGLETAKRARALGMQVIGCNRMTSRPMPDVSDVVDLASISCIVAKADFVIVCCALTEETRHIVNASVLAAMKPTAFIINVGRGYLIEERALYEALRARRIAGAVLDVWYRYPDEREPQPRPSDLPFHDLDNVIMTPHSSGRTDGMVQRRWAEIAGNLDKLSAGSPLANFVTYGRAATG